MHYLRHFVSVCVTSVWSLVCSEAGGMKTIEL